MISKNDLKDYIKIFEDSSLAVLELEDEDGMRILMEKPQVEEREVQVVTQPVVSQVAAENVVCKKMETDNSKVIKSPMVGVFYSAASPDSEPFVSVGKTVRKGEVVCIVEAMKIMNEITAEESGVITEILVENGDVVEYNQPLFRID